MKTTIVFDGDGTLVKSTAQGLELYAGIRSLLENLKAQEFKLFLWTGRDRISCEEYLIRLKLLPLFEKIHTSSDPHPKPITAGLRDLVAPAVGKNTVIVGDSPMDMLGAKNFGAFAIGALWDEEAKKPAHEILLQEFRADALARTPKDCYDLILKWSQE